MVCFTGSKIPFIKYSFVVDFNPNRALQSVQLSTILKLSIFAPRILKATFLNKSTVFVAVPLPVA